MVHTLKEETGADVHTLDQSFRMEERTGDAVSRWRSDGGSAGGRSSIRFGGGLFRFCPSRLVPY